MSAGSGAIVGTSLVSLYEGIGPQDRDDILGSLAHADGFASRHYDQQQEYSNWIFRYQTRLQQRGWRFVNAIRHTPQVIFHPPELDSISYHVIDSAGSRALAELAQAAWSALSINRYAQTFFMTGNRNQELGRLQMIPCMLDASGEIILLVCCIRLTGTVDTRDFDFWTETRREMLLRITGGVYRFDRKVFAGYRDEIHRLLAGDADRAIRHFPI